MSRTTKNEEETYSLQRARCARGERPLRGRTGGSRSCSRVASRGSAIRTPEARVVAGRVSAGARGSSGQGDGERRGNHRGSRARFAPEAGEYPRAEGTRRLIDVA